MIRQGLAPGTLTTHEQVEVIFLEWLHCHNVEVEEGYQVDDLLVELRNNPVLRWGQASFQVYF